MRNLILTIAALLLLPIAAASQANIKMKTANVQHGTYTSGSFNFAGQATLLSAGSTDVVAAQEVSGGDLSNWDSGFTTGGMTRAVYQAHWGSPGDGNAIWYRSATTTIINTYTHDLANVANPFSGSTTFGWDGTTDIRRTVVAVKASINNQPFYVVSAHFCASTCSDASGSLFSAQRVSQAEDLVSWINSTLTGAPVFVLGDFNFRRNRPKNPSGFQIDVLLEAGYTDLWAAGITAGTATANWGDRNSDGQADMPLGVETTRTHDTQAIDYMMSKGSGVALTSIDVPDLRETCPHGLVAGGTFPSCSPEVNGGPGISGQQWDIPEDFGVRPSDHNWLTAVVTVTSSKRGTMRGHNTVRRGSLR